VACSGTRALARVADAQRQLEARLADKLLTVPRVQAYVLCIIGSGLAAGVGG
jgi:hypothetical protein